MEYGFASFLAVLVIASVHLFAERTRRAEPLLHSRLLSTGSGVALAYVFIDILPKLSQSDLVVRNAIWPFFPYFEHHVYVMALAGFILFFIVDRSEKTLGKSSFFYLSLSSYALFNFLVGYAVVDKDNPEVQPLLLFTFAMVLHYFMNDYSLNEAHGRSYSSFGKWILIASLFLGWFAGFWVEISPAGIGLVSAFIGGGVIMNVTRHELPSDNPNSISAFLTAALVYTAILLSLGPKG